MSLAQIQEAPDRGVILLVGPPGAGKSAFCQQVVLNGLALDRLVIYVTTNRGATEAIRLLNGLFASVRGNHVREIKCITMGDPYCEWEII